MISKYEQSRHFTDFYIAGFLYHDGLDVIDKLKFATVVDLRPEPSNPYDPNAVAVYFGEKHIGYIPQTENAIISKLLYFGHDIFEALISAIALDKHPEKQFRVSVKLKDGRR